MSDDTNPYRHFVMPTAIAAAIMSVKKQIRQLGADERNEHARYNYVSVDKFYATIGPLMADAGLALLINEAESEVKPSEKGTPWLFVRYELTFLHESGAMSTLPMSRSLAMPINGPQTYGAAQSYIEKQFLRQVFKVPTGEKDADEVAQGDDVPARGRRTQAEAMSGNGARAVPRRQEAAPAPAPEQAEVAKRVLEIRADIDREEDPKVLRTLDEWPAFQTLDRLYHQAAPKDAADAGMQMLLNRARKRVEQLVGSLEPFGGER